MIAGTVHWHGQISKIEARPAIECYSLLFRTVNGLGGAWETPVCTENSDSGVLVMQPADHGMRHDVSTPLNRACEWRIFVQRSVRSDFVVIARIGLQHRRRCASPSTTMWSTQSRQIDPISLSANAFCHQKKALPSGIGPDRGMSAPPSTRTNMHLDGNKFQRCQSTPFPTIGKGHPQAAQKPRWTASPSCLTR